MQRARQFGFLTMVFLVALRLAIGWHFLFEGVHKLESFAAGETTTSKPFSSAGYFREAPGPLAREMRQHLGDPDDEALARLTVTPASGPEEPGAKPYERVPPALNKEWEDYVNDFARRYSLDDKQRALADGILKEEESEAVWWLTLQWDPKTPRAIQSDEDKEELTEIDKPAPSGDATLKALETPAERVREYRQKVQEYRDMLDQTDAVFGQDVVGARRLAAKADAATMRKSLMSDLDRKTGDLKQRLANLLTDEQANQGAPVQSSPPLLWWLDGATAWGLTVIGGCLLLGLLTRTNCVLAAGFLLMTYFASPPWPWLPTPPNNEGNYLFDNKNVVEMFALLALATTASGRWVGLDALVSWTFAALFGRKTPQPVPARRAA